MKIQGLIQQFIERIQTSSHLSPLLPEERIYIRFEWENENIVFAISKNGTEKKKEEEDEQRLLTIRGSAEAIHTLLTGELKLQQQMRLKELSVVGSFRHMLLLESIFHLGKTYLSVNWKYTDNC
ncbi:hypothetical protein B0I26_10941 [Anoxybacillus vitaminiphilus]|uniref:SCP-2 sterol transfer family protein n=1 Tax=Paranoxybacillus vitaminiphilus TaxID=581036 RepID=A0A327YDR9_9BACL|nr:sterol-binding protein [Anoxybacillus vitaminiphilus]RAK18621.1 hypothetical protein B0I26_10941 [Anoxybacillus vitaminiphilus]